MLQLSILFLISVLFVFCLIRIVWKKNEVGGNYQNLKIGLISVLISISSILTLISGFNFEDSFFDWVQAADYLVSILFSSLALILMMYIVFRQTKSQKGKLKLIKFIIFVLLLLIGDKAYRVNTDCEIQLVGEFNLACD